MPTRRCCCGEGCPDYCLLWGDKHDPCGDFETALFYILGPAPGTLYLGTGPCRIEIPAIQIRSPADCEWVGTSGPPLGPGNPEPTWTLEIISEDEAEIRVEYDGDVYIYRPSEVFEEEAQCQVFERPYDPLCTHVFEFDEEDSDVPGCLIPRCVCVFLANGCCDSPNIRTEGPLPRTLYATVVFCFGETSNNEEEIEMVWDGTRGPTGAWYGSKTVGNNTMELELLCNCGIEDGCGTGESPCYVLNARHASCSPDWEALSVEFCECEPFELTEVIYSTPQFCCAAEFTQDWLITITE